VVVCGVGGGLVMVIPFYRCDGSAGGCRYLDGSNLPCLRDMEIQPSNPPPSTICSIAALVDTPEKYENRKLRFLGW